SDETELAVFRGTASLTTERDSLGLGAGQVIVARADGLSRPGRFNSARFDEFDAWSNTRRDERLGSVQDAEYLPADLRTYSGEFYQNGSWGYERPYGYVWYPNVGPEWRPYYNGYWDSIPAYGWTWIGLERWSWPTHHYGRWGFARSRWYWIPDRRW